VSARSETRGQRQSDAALERVALGERGEHGHLEVEVESGRVTDQSPAGRRTVLTGHLRPGEARALSAACTPDGSIVCLVPRRGETFWLIDRERGRIREVPFGERLGGSAEVAITAEDEDFIVVTEAGFLVISARHGERWRYDRITYGWRFVGASEGYLWFADADENLVSFDPLTGHEGGY